MRWWLFVAFTFLSLSYSLSFNLLYSFGDDVAPLTMRHVNITPNTWDYAPQNTALTRWELWVCCDSPSWLQQTHETGSVIPPFRYRVAIPALVRLIPLPAIFAWQLWNIAMITALGTGMTAYLMRYYQFNHLTALLGGFMAVATVPVTRTALVPGIDISTMVVILMLLAGVQEKRVVFYVLIAVIAVLTKEMFIIAALLWLVYAPKRQWLWALVPLCTFVAIRLFYGASPVEVNYGYDLLNTAQAAEIGTRYARFNAVAIGTFLLSMLFSLNYLWLGVPLALSSDRRTVRTLLIVVLMVTGALFFLSSQIQRNTGLIAIVLIPPLLNTLQERYA